MMVQNNIKNELQMEDENVKILQVIDTLSVGGGEKIFVEVCNILYNERVNITSLFLLKKGFLQRDLNENIPFIELNRTNKWSCAEMYRCSKILKQYDLIHCHFRYVYKYISLVAKLFGVKSKIILHDHYGSIDIDKRVPFLLNSVLKPNFYIGVSNTLQDWAVDSLQIKRNRVFVLENIVSKSLQKQQYSKRYDLILVSNIKQLKNNKFGLEIVEHLNASLLLIGKNQNEAYYNEIIERKNRNGLSCDIDITQNNIQPILHCSKLGLHTSISESGPLVLIEYLAQGLPFLAYETGEVARILKPYFPEFFIDNFEVDQWAERIKMLLSKNADIEKMEEVFEMHFGKESYFNKLKNIYICVLKS
ncbi:Glycosyl transferases group 1 [compost metagenome]